MAEGPSDRAETGPRPIGPYVTGRFSFLALYPFTGERPWTPGALVSVVNSIFTATYAYLPGAEAVRMRIIGGLAGRPPHLAVPYHEVDHSLVPGAQP